MTSIQSFLVSSQFLPGSRWHTPLLFLGDTHWIVALYRQSLCGTSCPRTTSTLTLLSDGESAWKTSCCVLHHILSFPMTKFSSSFWQRLALKHVPHNIPLMSSVIHMLTCTPSQSRDFKLISTIIARWQNKARGFAGGRIKKNMERQYSEAISHCSVFFVGGLSNDTPTVPT